MLAFVRLLLVFIHVNRVSGAIISSRTKQYEEMRAAIVGAEFSFGLGGKVFLSSAEQRADQVIKDLKRQELFSSETSQIVGMHFFDARPLIEQSQVFKALKLMPKGAILHLHNSAAVSSRWVIRNLTYRQEAKLCQRGNQYLFTVSVLTFIIQTRSTNRISCMNGTAQNLSYACRPIMHCSENNTQRITEMRKAHGNNVDAFDDWLESIINMRMKKMAKNGRFTTINELWIDFESCFEAMKGFLQYKPFFEAYHWQLLHEFYNDNVYHIELRTPLTKLFDAEGKEYGPPEVVMLLRQTVHEFRRQHPFFHGVKVIFAKHKNMSNMELENALKMYDTLSSTFPGFVIGFDLVGQEDNNRSLKSFAPSLLAQSMHFSSPSFFFHAGETVSYYTEADENMIDAVLLNTRRIGHGYALIKHPLLWHAIRLRQIAIEVCPISNQVLGLVRDLRNHPASFYVTQSIPITIASDDPGFWDAVGISYDFYYTFMAIAPNAGLGFLKQLVWDSLKYSAISPEERLSITGTMENQWRIFIQVLGNANFTAI